MCRAVVSRLDVVVVPALVFPRAASAVQRICRYAVPTNKGMFGGHAGVGIATERFEPVAQGALGAGHFVDGLAHDHGVALAVGQRVEVLLEGKDMIEGDLALFCGHDLMLEPESGFESNSPVGRGLDFGKAVAIHKQSSGLRSRTVVGSWEECWSTAIARLGSNTRAWVRGCACGCYKKTRLTRRSCSARIGAGDGMVTEEKAKRAAGAKALSRQG